MNLPLAKYLDRYVGIFLCYLLAAIHLFKEMASPSEDTVRVRKILLVKLWGVGNIILLLPIIRLIRERYPRARIHMLTLERNSQLLVGNPNLDRIWTVSESGIAPLAGSLFGAFFGLRRAKIDLFLDFEQFARTSALLGFAIGAPQRLGLKTPRQGRSVLYTAQVRYREDQHMSQTFLDVARAAGVEAVEYEPDPLDYSEEESDRVASLLGEVDGPVVTIHVGSGDNFIGRRWPSASFALLADLLVLRHGVVPVFTGSRGEIPLVAEVLTRMKTAPSSRNLTGRLTLRELAALLDRSAFLVSNDTGPVHIASGLSRPVLGLYGPNTPALYGPLSPGSHAFYRNLPCSPCITNINYKTSFCRLPVCIRNITVKEVYAEAEALLAGGTPGRMAS